jgi:hypothetical protein
MKGVACTFLLTTHDRMPISQLVDHIIDGKGDETVNTYYCTKANPPVIK